MADDNLYSLLIRVEGGDAAAAELIKAKYALKEVEDQSGALRKNFNEGFQHVALRGFSMEAARAVGIGGELRPMLHLASMGLDEVAASAGLAGSSMLLFGEAFVALAAIAYVIHGHMEKHAEDLEKNLKGYKEDTEGINAYVAAGGRLEGALKAVADATDYSTKKTLEGITAKTKETLEWDKGGLALASNTLAHAMWQQQQGQTVTDMQHLIDVTNEWQKKVAEGTQTLIANEHGFATWQGYVKSGTETLKDNKKEADEAAKAQEKLSHELSEAGRAADEQGREIKTAGDKMVEATQTLADKTRTAADQEAEATTDAHAKRAAQIQKFQDDSNRVVRAYEKQIEAAKEYGFDTTQMEQQLAAYQIQIHATVAQKVKENYTAMQTSVVQLANSIGASIDSSLARAVVDSKNSAQEMQQLTKAVEEQVVASLIKMAAEAIATTQAFIALKAAMVAMI